MRSFQGQVAETVNRNGVALIVAEDSDGVPFGYSMGFSETARHPEILMVGCSQRIRQSALDFLQARIVAGETFGDWSQIDGLLRTGPVFLREVVVEESGPLGGVMHDLDPDARVLQLLFPDKSGLFPWHAGCDTAFRRQQDGVVYLTHRLHS